MKFSRWSAKIWDCASSIRSRRIMISICLQSWSSEKNLLKTFCCFGLRPELRMKFVMAGVKVVPVRLIWEGGWKDIDADCEDEEDPDVERSSSACRTERLVLEREIGLGHEVLSLGSACMRARRLALGSERVKAKLRLLVAMVTMKKQITTLLIL